MTAVRTACSWLVLAAACLASSLQAGERVGVGPDEALRRLQEGNRRFVAGKSAHGADHSQRMAEVAKGQSPLAVVVGCSDSRADPDIVLDEDLGDLFVVRSAGHVVGDVELGSIEYAVEHLDTSLVVVLGHERCGAVSAAVAGGEASGHLPAVVDAIKPAVEETKGLTGDPVENAMRANVRRVVRQLKNASPILAERVESGKVKIVGARYDLDTGRMELLEP